MPFWSRNDLYTVSSGTLNSYYTIPLVPMWSPELTTALLKTWSRTYRLAHTCAHGREIDRYINGPDLLDYAK